MHRRAQAKHQARYALRQHEAKQLEQRARAEAAAVPDAPGAEAPKMGKGKTAASSAPPPSAEEQRVEDERRLAVAEREAADDAAARVIQMRMDDESAREEHERELAMMDESVELLPADPDGADDDTGDPMDGVDGASGVADADDAAVARLLQADADRESAQVIAAMDQARARCAVCAP